MTVEMCYVGLNSEGTIVAAVVIQPKYPERAAVAIAGFVMSGLTVQLATVEEVREKLWKGEMVDLPKMRYHVRILQKKSNGFHIEEDGDDELEGEYGAYLDCYGSDCEERILGVEEDTEAQDVIDVPENQLPLF